MQQPKKHEIMEEMDWDPEFIIWARKVLNAREVIAEYVKRWIDQKWSYDCACDILGLAFPFLHGPLRTQVANWLDDDTPNDASDMDADRFMPKVYKQLTS